MSAIYGVLILGGTVLGSMNLYQAVTGTRLSKKPSVRTYEVMRRESRIAAAVLLSASAMLALIVFVLPR